MILRAIQVEGWRRFADPVTVGPLAPGVNVLFGLNGAGKSTLVEAIVRGLLDNHLTTGDPAEALRPWGRDLAPRVTIEFEHEGHRYRVEKQFLVSPRSELCREEDGQFKRLAESRGADKQVREMLGAEPPSRGLSEVKHWGLAQVLWAPQGSLALPDLADTSVPAAVHAALDVQVSDRSTGPVHAKLSAAYHAIFTRKEGKRRTGANAPPLAGLETELSEKCRQRDALDAQLEMLDAERVQIETLGRRRDALAREEEKKKAELAEASRRAGEYKDLKSKCDVEKAKFEKAALQYGALKQTVDEIAKRREGLGEDQKALKRHEDAAPGRADELWRRDAALAEAKSRLDALGARRDERRKAIQEVELAARFVAQRKQRDDLDRLLARAEEAIGQRDEHAGRLAALAAPDAPRFREIQAAHARGERARQRLDAAGVRVVIEPERECEIEVTEGTPPGARPLRPGEPITFLGDPSLAFRLPGVGAFRASRPVDASIDSLRSELDEAEKQFLRLTEGLPTRDVAALKRLRDQADEAERDRRDAQSKLDGILGQWTVEKLRAERDEADDAASAILIERPDWADSPDEPTRLAGQIEQARAAVEAVESELHAARDARDQEAASRNDAQRAHEQHDREMQAIRERIAKTDRELAELTGDVDDANRKSDLDQLALTWNAAKAQSETAQRQLEQFDEDPAPRVQLLSDDLEKLRRERSEVEQELGVAQGSLKSLVAAAPYSALNPIVERIDRLQREIAAERLRHDAIRLLFQTVEQCRAEAVESVLAPVQCRATELFARIAGRRLGEVRLDDRSLAVERLAIDPVERPVELNELSGGENEQVHLAVRLALAEVLAQEQRQLVVLDDVLTATDPERLARIREILAEAGQRLQILVLTCDRDRFESVPSAKFFDLGEITARR
ncbi:MAG: AAA family ATPase [Pirellulales bacterium]|nr:AAA family ATPase [Pirellulales bacterium]